MKDEGFGLYYSIIVAGHTHYQGDQPCLSLRIGKGASLELSGIAAMDGGNKPRFNFMHIPTACFFRLDSPPEKIRLRWFLRDCLLFLELKGSEYCYVSKRIFGVFPGIIRHGRGTQRTVGIWRMSGHDCGCVVTLIPMLCKVLLSLMREVSWLSRSRLLIMFTQLLLGGVRDWLSQVNLAVPYHYHSNC